MIRHGSEKSSTKTCLKLAWVTALIWLVVIGVLWFALKNASGEGGGFLNFLGRWHVLIVHLPIALLGVVGIIEIFFRGKNSQNARDAIPALLWLGFLGAVGSTILGFVLMKSEGTAGLAMPLHMWSGFAVVVFSFVALVAQVLEKRGVYALSLMLSIGAVAAAGHYGGALVHGKDYLTEHAPESIKAPLETVAFLGLGGREADVIEEVPAEIPFEEKNAYAAFVAPILAEKCNQCHDENKTKGKLRMDTHDLLLAGAEGSDYPTVEPGDADNSELIVRVTLPADDDDFMPPSGDDEPLTEAEIEILKWWIKAGAPEDKTVAELTPKDEISGLLAAFDATRNGAEIEEVIWEPEWESLSDEERETRLAAAHEAAQKWNFSLMPISAEDDRLRVNVINAAKDFGDDQLAELEPIAEHILWLNVKGSQITDDGLKSINKMRNLEQLHLEETAVTDKGVAKLEPLAKLEYLNLHSTKVTTAIFEHFRAMPNLRKIYLWQTGVDPASANSYERSVNLEVNTGISLTPPPAPPSEPAPSEKKEAPKPAPKKEEKKPTPQN